MSGPTNLKALAQFNLYGDPSLNAVVSANQIAQDELKGMQAEHAVLEDLESGRNARRMAFRGNGATAGSMASFPIRVVGTDRPVVRRVHEIAQQRGFSKTPRTIDPIDQMKRFFAHSSR